MAQQYLEVIPQREARNRAKREIEDTFTNKSAMLIEDTLRTWLQRVVNEIKDEFDDNPEGYKQPDIYKLVQREVGDGLRQATEAFYRLAIEYVNRVNQTNAFFTTRDAANVKTISTDNTNWILRKFNDYFSREDDILKNEKESEPVTKLMAELEKKSHSPLVVNDMDTVLNAVKKLNSFNIDSNITNIAVITSTRAINFGTIDKTIQLAEVPLESIIVTQSAAVPSIAKKILEAAKKLAAARIQRPEGFSYEDIAVTTSTEGLINEEGIATDYIEAVRKEKAKIESILALKPEIVKAPDLIKSIQAPDLVKALKVELAKPAMAEALGLGKSDTVKALEMLDKPVMARAIESQLARPDTAKALELGLRSQQIIDAGFTPAKYVPRSMFVTKAGDVRAKSLFQQRDIQTTGMYITSRDDLVCLDICMPLDGLTYDLTDIDNIPIPGDLDHQSHPHCRCRMILVDEADLVAMWG